MNRTSTAVRRLAQFPNWKMDPRRVARAKRLYALGYTQKEIAESLGVSPTLISYVIRGKRWAGD